MSVMMPSHYRAVGDYVELHGKRAAREFFGNLEQVETWIVEVTKTPIDEIPQRLIEQLSRECIEYLDFSPDGELIHRVPDKQREWIEDLVRTHGKEVVLERFNRALHDPEDRDVLVSYSLLTNGSFDKEMQVAVIEAAIAFVEGLE